MPTPESPGPIKGCILHCTDRWIVRSVRAAPPLALHWREVLPDHHQIPFGILEERLSSKRLECDRAIDPAFFARLVGRLELDALSVELLYDGTDFLHQESLVRQRPFFGLGIADEPELFGPQLQGCPGVLHLSRAPVENLRAKVWCET